MLRLIKKEFLLSMHPTVPFMLMLCLMVLIPNYPYTVIFFYTTMGIFFTCLSGRENNDIGYTMSLPISKSDIVKGRFLFSVILELASLALTVPFIFLSQRLNTVGNSAGLDANLALVGQGFVTYGVFNLVFFSSYYKNVVKVGLAFVKSSIALTFIMLTDIVLTYAVPFVREVIDTPDNSNPKVKLCCLFIGAVVYVVTTFAAYRISLKRFEQLDI